LRYLIRILWVVLAIGSINLGSPAQDPARSTGPRPEQSCPWTSIIPDPDRFDWTTKSGSRIGYRYRGILPRYQPFYEYIQEKRNNDQALSWAEEALVRHLITFRRWPDPPAPNPFWAAYMRYLRAQRNADLSVAEMILLDQLIARGFLNEEPPADSNLSRVRDYLNSPLFDVRSWFERTSAFDETWLANLSSGWGYDMPYDAPYDPAVIDDMKSELQKTLARLNDRGTPLGREIENMQRALGEGQTAWESYLSQRAKQMQEDSSAEFSSYQELENALNAGGERWAQYIEANRTADSEAAPKVSTNVQQGVSRNETASNAQDLIEKALTYCERNEYGQAVFLYTKALDVNPKSAEAYAGRALAKAALNDLEGATGDINRALKLDPECASAFRARSIIKRALADPTGALADAKRAVELAPTDPRFYLTRGLANEALKDYDAAIVDYTSAINLNPKYALSFLYRGLARLKANQNQAAVGDFDKAIADDASNGLAYLSRGLAKEEQGDVEGAIADYKEAIRINPQDEAAKQRLLRLKSRNDEE
jgi:tetratricopeptide (TPR) repeat protein